MARDGNTCQIGGARCTGTAEDVDRWNRYSDEIFGPPEEDLEAVRYRR